jgi:hypothetical protein
MVDGGLLSTIAMEVRTVMVPLKMRQKLRVLSFDDFEAYLFSITDDDGFLSVTQMSEFGVQMKVPLHAFDFLDFFLFILLSND